MRHRNLGKVRISRNVIDNKMENKQFTILDSLVLDNKEEYEEWRNPRMDKGYSFEYVKSKLFGITINTAIKCIEDGQKQ